MSRVVGDISMSLDGYVTAAGVDAEHGLGVGGEAIHEWALNPSAVDREILAESTDGSGAVIMGRHLFNFIDGPHGWNDEMGYGASAAATPPFFVVTASEPTHVRLELDFTFVLDGIEAAVRQAQDAAGDRDVVVMGGGEVVRSALDAGVLDLLRIHLAPVVLGGGTPLFVDGMRHDLRQHDVRVSPLATHLVYAVAARGR